MGEGSNQRAGERREEANKREGREEEEKWEQTREISEHSGEGDRGRRRIKQRQSFVKKRYE